MKFSYKLSDAIHLLSYLNIYHDTNLSSKAIAASINSNPSVVRQLMSDLRKANLIETHKGAAKPTLVKDPKDISLLEIYQAINMDHRLIHVDPDTNSKCIVGGNIQNTLNGFYNDIESAAFAKMSQISLQDVISDILKRQAQKEKRWE